VKRLNEGVHLIAMMQTHLISELLLEWKNSQKLSQIGVVFEQREQQLDEIQTEYVMGRDGQDIHALFISSSVNSTEIS
jgi:hypothetical protein